MTIPLQSSIGFGSVALPATAGQFVQLPAIACDVIGFGRTTGDLRLATSASPGGSYLLLNTAASGNSANAAPAIPTGGNAANLWLANDTAGAQTVGFMWVQKGVTYEVPAV
jgi:hypothetical protein